jgi:hypothetical protein
MWDMFYTIANNLGSSVEIVVLIGLVVGSLIFFAQDFKIGIISLMMSGALGFMWFYSEGLNYKPFIVVFFMSLVLLALSLYPIGKQTDRGAFI